MEPIRWPISIKTYKNYFLMALTRAVAQQKWNNVHEIISCVLTCVDLQPDSYFVWKIVHCLMINLNLPINVQKNLLRAFSDHITDWSVMYLEWIFQSFHIKKNSIKDIFQVIKKAGINSDFEMLSSLQCFAYYKLHNYYEWVKKLEETNVSYELKEEGDIIYKALEESYHKLQNYSANIEKVTKNEYELSTPKSCEWLLGPMLDMKRRMVALNYAEPDEKKDLILLNKYIENAGNHLPALKLSVNYIQACYPHRKLPMVHLLQRICILSPGDAMVLTYVKFFRKKSSDALKQACKYENINIDFEIDEYDIDDESNNNQKETPPNKDCQINGLSVTVTVHCIKTIIMLLEYPEWQNNIKSWSLLTNLLNKLYVSWINCYYCINCFGSRKKIRKVLHGLALWPVHIWRMRLPLNASQEEALVTMHRAFSAYVLGYDKRALIDATMDLHYQGHIDTLKQLDDLISVDGRHQNIVRKFLSRNKKLIISKLALYPDDIQITDRAETFQITIIKDDQSITISEETMVNRKKRKNDDSSLLKSKKQNRSLKYKK